MKNNNIMKSENLVNAVMKELKRLGVMHNPDIPMFKKSMERLAAQMCELVDEGKFCKAYPITYKLETAVISFANSLWINGYISFRVANELKRKFSTFVNAKRSELWDKAVIEINKDGDEKFIRVLEQGRHEFDNAYQRSVEEAPIDCNEFERRINKKLQEMQKIMNKFHKPSTIIIIMK